MKILHVIGTLSPRDGGPPEVTRQLARSYVESGDTLEVVCQDPPGAPYLRDVPCTVHALGQRWIGRYGFSPRLWKWLHENARRFDCIVRQGIWGFPDIAVRSACRKAGIPYGIFPHGALDPWFNQQYPLKHFKKMLYWPIQSHVLRDARAVFFTCDLEAELAATSFHPHTWKSIVFPYGICAPRDDAAQSVELFYRTYPSLLKRRFLLLLARIHEKKGCDLLLRAFARVAAAEPDLDLMIAGPDAQGRQSGLERMAQELGITSRVHWPGILGNDLKWGALRAAEAFILPSHQENFGIAIVESLAAGRPVLITNKVNIWREIENGKAGLIDEDTLEGVERLLRGWLALTPKERDAMSARAYPLFTNRFSLRCCAQTIHSVLGTKDLTKRSFASASLADADWQPATGIYRADRSYVEIERKDEEVPSPR
jgi:glycosyltransferase involved in cell wall biosynthesis